MDARHDGMYEIGEMARLFGVSRQTLIYYDRIGLFKPARVSGSGYRFYAPTQIPALRLICILRDLGVELKEIERAMRSRDTDAITGLLRGRLDAIDAQVAGLLKQRASVEERLGFYSGVGEWREREGVPTLRAFPERRVLVEPFDTSAPSRPELHATLMRAVARLKVVSGTGPMRGWGTVLRRGVLGTDEPLRGAGPFAIVPDGVDTAGIAGVETLPAGIYLCVARWGMPYDPAGARLLLSAARSHGLRLAGDAYDFCLLDTTSYDDAHSVDFCCLQVPVELG